MMTKNITTPDTWEIKSCVACGRSNLPPTYSQDKKEALYNCDCGSKYKASFVFGDPVRLKALVILEGKEFYINALSLKIFQGRILLDSKVLQDLED